MIHNQLFNLHHGFKNAGELVSLGALKFSLLIQLCIFMGKIFLYEITKKALEYATQNIHTHALEGTISYTFFVAYKGVTNKQLLIKDSIYYRKIQMINKLHEFFVTLGHGCLC